jgi:probable HAF family extracellular repeat protein
MAPPRAVKPRCFAWSPTDGYIDIGLQLNATNPPMCVAHALNDNGLVVGTYWRSDNTTSAFSYYIATGRVVDLGGLTGIANTEARGVSAVGEVIGWGLGAGVIYWSGFARWEVIADSEVAESINSRGQIAGMAKGTQFRSTPVVWTPGSAHGQWTNMPLGCHYTARDCLPMGLNDHGNSTNAMSIANANIIADVVGVVRGRQEPWYEKCFCCFFFFFFFPSSSSSSSLFLCDIIGSTMVIHVK